MSKKPTKYTDLKPWIFVGCSGFGITLTRHVNEEDGEVWYNSSIDLELDSGKKKKHFTSIITQIYEECPHCCALKTLMAATTFSDEFFDKIMVFDDSGKEIDVGDDRLSISKLYDELHDSTDGMDEEKVLH